MTQIAMKFVQWDVPELEKLKDSKVYKLRERLDNGDKLSREEKNWLTRNVKECCYFKRGIALMGYRFDFSDVLKRYFVKQHGHIAEYYAIDKTALRSVLYGRIEDIIEVQIKIKRSMKVTIEHSFCPYCDEVTELYFRIINTILFSGNEAELRESMRQLEKKTPLDEYFTYGYGARHLWVCQRCPSDKTKIFEHRIMMVEFQ